MKEARPKLLPVSEEMKAWSAAIATEAAEWPGCTARSFFGFVALYRKERMFGALPRTRAVWTPNGLAFKLDRATAQQRKRLKNDPRVGSTLMHDARWFTFEISSNQDLHDALGWLGEAFDEAGKPKKVK